MGLVAMTMSAAGCLKGRVDDVFSGLGSEAWLLRQAVACQPAEV